jgi:hypothetical protein
MAAADGRVTPTTVRILSSLLNRSHGRRRTQKKGRAHEKAAAKFAEEEEEEEET